MGKLVLEVENSTPLLVGWYRPELADPQGIRPTEVKGLWRWWARAFVGGALYDQGLLSGVPSKGVLLKPSKWEVELLAGLVGAELGLGLAVAGRSQASKFSLYVEPLGRVSPTAVGDSWQRVRLLRLGNRRLEGIEAGRRFRLYVEWGKDFKYLGTALKILLVALQFTGLGKGSRRGLGSLDVVSVNQQGIDIGELRDLKSLVKEVYDECLELVTASKLVREYADRGRERGPPPTGTALPPLPVVSKSRVLEAPVASMKVLGDVPSARFVDVHNFFVRTERCRVLYGNPKCYDDLRQRYLAWFLGLPRSQRGTGYITAVDRRASPVTLALHTSRNKFGGGAFVAVFLSGDWPQQVEWSGGYPRQKIAIQIGTKAIVDACSGFSAEFSSYLSKLGIGQKEVTVWP